MIPGLGSLQALLLGGAALLAVGFVSGCEVRKWKSDSDQLATEQATQKIIEDARTSAEALGLAEGQITITAGQRFATQSQEQQTHTITLIQKVPMYVESPTSPSRVCTVPLGIVRLLNAAVRDSADPDASFPLPAGKSNDSVTAIDLAALASNIIRNYGIANGNAAQLDALIEWTRKQEALINKRGAK